MKAVAVAIKALFGKSKRSLAYQLASALEEEESRATHPSTQLLLEDKHLGNCKVIEDRNEMLKLLPKKAIVAEIGVLEGAFSSEILNKTFPQKMYLIDSWKKEFEHLKSGVEAKFAEQIVDGVVKVMQSNSIEALNSFDDEYFDWVYLDSDHSYDYTLQELITLSKKVKKGGFICGDDYTLGVWYVWNAFGVVYAVNEFCIKYNYEMVYLALAPGSFNSFALRRIADQ